MENLKKYVVLSPAVLGGVALCFFMNFFTIQCSNQKLASISGYDMVLGSEIKADSMMGGEKAEKLPPNMWAIAALLLTVAAIAVCFINPAKKLLITAALAFAAFIALLILKNTLLSQMDMADGGEKVSMDKIAEAISIVPEPGYYLALIGLAAVGLSNALLLKETPKEETSKEQTPTGEQT